LREGVWLGVVVVGYRDGCGTSRFKPEACRGIE